MLSAAPRHGTRSRHARSSSRNPRGETLDRVSQEPRSGVVVGGGQPTSWIATFLPAVGTLPAAGFGSPKLCPETDPPIPCYYQDFYRHFSGIWVTSTSRKFLALWHRPASQTAGQPPSQAAAAGRFASFLHRRFGSCIVHVTYAHSLTGVEALTSETTVLAGQPLLRPRSHRAAGRDPPGERAPQRTLPGLRRRGAARRGARAAACSLPPAPAPPAGPRPATWPRSRAP